MILNPKVPPSLRYLMPHRLESPAELQIFYPFKPGSINNVSKLIESAAVNTAKFSKKARAMISAPTARKGQVPTLVAETGSKVQLGPGSVLSWIWPLPEKDDVCVYPKDLQIHPEI